MRFQRLPAKTIAAIAELTACNDHGLAYHRVATTLGCTELADTFARINSEHIRIGHLSDELNSQRYAAYQRLMQEAKARLAAADYDALYGAL